ncbi:MAG TPA: MFS transporter [Actinomycetes bacterium]|nr:MFS transporter [Actinomycetes bacterium]
MPVTPATAPTRPRSLLALSVILLAQLMVVLDVTVVNIALPDLQSSLGFSRTDLSWVLNAYTLTFGGLLLLGARAGDLYGRRRVFVAGVVVFTAASMVAGLAASPAVLLAARAVQGVGAAFAAPSALALLMISFPEGRERARALGLYTGVSIGGSAVGLILGGTLTEFLSWRWVFFINVPVGVVLVALAGRALPHTERARGGIDVPGAVSSTIGMAALVYGFVRAASDGWRDPGTLIAFAVGLALIATFVAVERTATNPITPLRLFASPDRVAAYVSRMLLWGGVMGVFFFLTQFLQDVLHYSAVRTGLAFLPLTIALFISSQVSARRLMGRVNPRLVMVGGMALSATGLLLLGRLGITSGYPEVIGSLLALGIGNGLAFVPLTAAALAGVAPEDSGAGSGLVNAAQQVGGSLGLAVLVTVFGSAVRAHAAQAGPVHAFVYGADRAFVLAGVLVALAALLASRIGARPLRPAEERLPELEAAAIAEAA